MLNMIQNVNNFSFLKCSPPIHITLSLYCELRPNSSNWQLIVTHIFHLFYTLICIFEEQEDCTNLIYILVTLDAQAYKELSKSSSIQNR